LNSRDFEVASGESISSDKNIDLEECLDSFTNVEQLGPNDTWYCSNCQALKQAFKKFDVWSVPPILIIHMKRFSYKSNYRDKIDSFIDFPFQIDLTNRVLNKKNTPIIFQLYAVSNHYGMLGGGHYTAYCLHRDGKWYDYNDSMVNEILPETVKTPAAYLLYYRRIDVEFKPFNPEWDKKELELNESVDSDNERENNGLIDYIQSRHI